MKNLNLIAAAFLSCLALPAVSEPDYLMQVPASVTGTTDSTAASNAANSLTIEGSMNSPSVAVGAGNSTAPCVMALGLGGSANGVGGGVNIPLVQRFCMTEAKSWYAAKLMLLPTSTDKQIKARNAAIYIACSRDTTVRAALVAVGACVEKKG